MNFTFLPNLMCNEAPPPPKNDTTDSWQESEEMGTLAHVQGHKAGKGAKQNQSQSLL